MDKTLTRVKKLALPIGIGTFALAMILIGVIYFMQWQEHNRYRSEIAELQAFLDITYERPEGLQEQYYEVLEAIPIVYEMIVQGAYTEVEFEEMVQSLIIDMAADTVKFPSIDTSRSGNLSISLGKTIKNVEVGSNMYKIYPFEIEIAKIGYDEVLRFAADLESMPELQTLVVGGLDVNTTEEKGLARIDISIYSLGS
jgi:hypothetical protein